MNPSTYSYRAFQLDAELLYAHLMALRKQESPREVVQHFNHLFVAGSGYPESRLFMAIDRIVTSRWAEREFLHILNRCCYILINHWWLQAESKPEFKQATLELVHLFEDSALVTGMTRSHRRLRELAAQFASSPQYEALRRRAWAADDLQVDKESSDRDRIGRLIYRYPCLYPHYLLDEDTSEIGQQAVKRRQAEQEKQFEHNLLNYATHLFQAQNSTLKNPTLKNPTLLTSQQLEGAIAQFVGKVELDRSYRESASRLSNEMSQAASYRTVKQQIQDYLTSSIHYSCSPGYGNHRFNDWLREQLGNTLPQCDDLKPSPHLIKQTCTQLLDSLIASPTTQSSNHLMFIDLNSNLGATFTIGLVLKIALLCRSVRSTVEAIKSHVARQFATIFRHYETSVRGDLGWLIECLDNFMVAFTIHFGQEDFERWATLF